MFEREAQFYALRIREIEKEREKQVGDAVSKIEDDLATVTEERDGLRERIQFMDRQLKKTRSASMSIVPVLTMFLRAALMD